MCTTEHVFVLQILLWKIRYLYMIWLASELGGQATIVSWMNVQGSVYNKYVQPHWTTLIQIYFVKNKLRFQVLKL